MNLQTFILVWIIGLTMLSAQDKAPVNMMRDSDFERTSPMQHPWGGVSEGGSLRVQVGEQTVVTGYGEVTTVAFPASVGVGDLNGDNLPDLVVADPQGYFWYFANTGKPGEPAFTSSEMIPISITKIRGSGERPALPCPKLNLTDVNDDGLLDLVLGDFEGKIYFILNIGRKDAPKFQGNEDPEEYAISTSAKGQLWANYLTPVYYDWDGDGKKDIVTGEGTYAANKIYLLKNTGTNTTPKFEETNRSVLIRGMGREQLVPQIVDWNADEKPDILIGERDGSVSIFLNTTTDKSNPTFAEAQPVMLGASSKVGTMASPCVVDFNGDGQFDLLFGRTNGGISVAYNKGTKGSPKFEAPVDIKGVTDLPKVGRVSTWSLQAPSRSLYHVMRTVSNDPANLVTFDKEYTPPSSTPGKSSLKFEIMRVPPKFVSGSMRLVKDRTYGFSWNGALRMKDGVPVEFKFSHKGSGWSNVKLIVTGGYEYEDADKLLNDYVTISEDFNASGGWSEFKKKLKIKTEKKDQDVSMSVKILAEASSDDPTLLLDDFSVITEK